MIPRLFCALSILCTLMLSGAVAQQQATVQDALTKEFQRLENLYGGHLGVMAKDLLTGETVAFNASERFPTASAIKLPVMAAFFHLADQGKIDPSMKVTLTNEDKKPGSGILQVLSDSSTITLLDAVKLMIILSDNSATNLVLDRLAATHEARMQTVNEFLVQKGLKNTRLLNRLYTWQTKKQTPESIRYGIGVSTPEDMVTLLELLYNRTLADTGSCSAMLEILKLQSYNDMIPRFLPFEQCAYLDVAHKTGGVNESKVDVGLVLSDKAAYAVAIFVDKHPDHREDLDNHAVLLAAYVSRAIWNHFTGMTGYDRAVASGDVDWNRFPGGSWAIYRTSAAPFPHKDRSHGWTRGDGTVYPYQPQYCDSSVVVFVPENLKETADGVNVIVHFHGHMNDDLGALEKYRMPQAMIDQKINALLVLPQGPYRARDSFGGKMEDEGGLKRLVDDVLATMKKEKVLASTRLGHLIISCHSGGGRAAAFCLDRGGLTDHVTDVLLFDALYEQHDFFRNWLTKGGGTLWGVYTEHLAGEHSQFEQSLTEDARKRVHFTRTNVEHDEVIQAFFPSWLSQLDRSWKMEGN